MSRLGSLKIDAFRSNIFKETLKVILYDKHSKCMMLVSRFFSIQVLLLAGN